MIKKHGEEIALRAESLSVGAEKIHLWLEGLRFFLRAPRSARRFRFYGGFGSALCTQRSALFLFFMLLVTCYSSPAFANNLSISNVSLEERNQNNNTAVVEFDISWDNAWNVSSAPGNHDAVWVFLKVCKGGSCSPTANTAWTHGMLATAGTDPADTDPGSYGSLTIEVPEDKMGAFIYLSEEGTQATVTSTDVRLTLDYNAAPLSASDTDDIQVRVFGIEMVYIPEGSFYIGDGDGVDESTYAFHVTDNTAVQLTESITEDITVDVNAYDDIDTYPLNVGAYVGVGGYGGYYYPQFPTGYKAFYLMKYELTQGQYRDFLNTLTQEQQNTRTAADLSNEDDANTYVMVAEDQATVSARQTIKAGANPSDGYPYTFGCDLNDNDVLDEADDGEWIAMGYASWMDIAAYADWAGLRPATELEFEKAARGPASPVYGEFAWGTTDITDSVTSGQSLINPGTSSEVGANTGDGLANYDSDTSDDPDGPMRVGFAATSATNRVSAGAGYYGNMEMSGNANEMYVTVGIDAGRRFDGTHGDGVLTTTSGYAGNATNTGWPGIDGTPARGITGHAGHGTLGGLWTVDHTTTMRISDRSGAAVSSANRGSARNARLARSAQVTGYPAVIYITTLDVNGEMNDGGYGGYYGRYGAKAWCETYKPDNLSENCVNVAAFLSSDEYYEIRDLPTRYGYDEDQPIYWWHDTNQTYTMMAANWSDALDGSILVPQATGTGIYAAVWTGSFPDGSLGPQNCDGWTDSTSGYSGYSGYYGSMSATTGDFIHDGALTCDNTLYLRCVCQIDEDAM